MRQRTCKGSHMHCTIQTTFAPPATRRAQSRQFVYLREAFCPSLDDEVSLLTQVTKHECGPQAGAAVARAAACFAAGRAGSDAAGLGGGRLSCPNDLQLMAVTDPLGLAPSTTHSSGVWHRREAARQLRPDPRMGLTAAARASTGAVHPRGRARKTAPDTACLASALAARPATAGSSAPRLGGSS